MKNSLYAFCLISFILFSCSSNDDDNNNSNDDNSLLLRKWYLVSSDFGNGTIEAPECSNGNVSYIEFISPNIYRSYTWDNDDNCDYFLEASGTWTRNGVLINIEFDQPYPEEHITIDELTASNFSYVSGTSYYVFTAIN
jgi:hypothetical protein